MVGAGAALACRYGARLLQEVGNPGAVRSDLPRGVGLAHCCRNRNAHRLGSLGFGSGMSKNKADYLRYLQSPSWLAKRHRLIRSNWAAVCYCCAVPHSPERPLDLHHLTYERFGREIDTDLATVCRGCHDLIHSGIKQGGSIQDATERVKISMGKRAERMMEPTKSSVSPVPHHHRPAPKIETNRSILCHPGSPRLLPNHPPKNSRKKSQSEHRTAIEAAYAAREHPPKHKPRRPPRWGIH